MFLASLFFKFTISVFADVRNVIPRMEKLLGEIKQKGNFFNLWSSIQENSDGLNSEQIIFLKLNLANRIGIVNGPRLLLNSLKDISV